MEIDWSKAPEWAQCVIESEEFSGQYYWAEPWGTSNGKRCAFGSEDRALRDFDVANTAGKNSWHLIESRPLTVADLKLESPTVHLQWCGRIERKSPWPESVLPPIGTECEAKNRMNDTWYRVKVIDHQGSVNSAVCREIGTDKLWWSDSFRPVRTAEEVAAELKKTGVEELIQQLRKTNGCGWYSIAEDLYDAGYRKVTP